MTIEIGANLANAIMIVAGCAMFAFISYFMFR